MFKERKKEYVKTRVMIRKSESKTMFYVFKVRQRKHRFRKRKSKNLPYVQKQGKQKHAVCSERDRQTDRQTENTLFSLFRKR